MRKNKTILLAYLLVWTALLISQGLKAQGVFSVKAHFNLSNVPYNKVGRGICQIKNGLLETKNAYASFGKDTWSDYEIRFVAKVPTLAKNVQIWAGFRAADREDRYIVGLNGGIQNNLYLGRLGYMGKDDFLALRHLDFSLKAGEDYHFKIQVVGDRIRIFLNNENLPRIDVIDKNASLAPSGKVTLGGSWIENDFSHLSIQSLAANALTNVPVKEYTVPPVDKEMLRKKERSAYQPVNVKSIKEARTVISLNGKWLFQPGYQIDDIKDAVSPDRSDTHWNILTVPNFWNPNRIWLFGEQYGTASKGVSDSYYQKEIDRCTAYTFDYKKTNIGWYRQWIYLPESIKGKHLELNFDAVSKLAEVWINGKKAGSHIGMFGDFKVDGTALLKPGKNLLVVKVYKNYLKDIKDAHKVVSVAVSEEVTQEMLKDLPHGFYDDNPAGIWQPVTLVVTNAVKIENVFIQPNMHGASFEVTIKNYSHKKQIFSLNTDIAAFKTGQRLYKGLSIKSIQLNAGAEQKLTYTINNINPALWSPAHPNIYNFNFVLDGDQKIIDKKVIRSGFKTFEVKNGYFYLNGKRYWLRGANQTAMPIAPNDTALADRFCQLMHQGNINVTRTHTAPYTEAWMNASDENGIGISYEGTWPWLMIGDSPIPDSSLLAIWKNEYFDLMKKYRNHPSLMIWTINNEMNFYDDDPNKPRAEKKMEIISNVVKQMRKIDPTHPVCYASNYSRKQTLKRFGKSFIEKIDDGDMDDIHYYPNWYNNSIFADFKGQFEKAHKYPGRPLISQELSTGYPDETGHATRFYTYVHQTPQAVIGNYAYSFNNPDYFLQTNAFLTKEEAEALRRTNPEAAGILHFSLATWFKNVYLAKSIQPFPTYYAIKKALQPILVSAELWGRHFYAGTKLPVSICIVNDAEDGNDLPMTTLKWQLVAENGEVFASGTTKVPTVKYYGRYWVEPQIVIPQHLPKEKVNGRLVLKLYEKDHLVAENDYGLLFATKQWAVHKAAFVGKKIVVVDPLKQLFPVLNALRVKYKLSSSIDSACNQKADEYIFVGLNATTVSPQQIKEIKALVAAGGKVLLSQSGSLAVKLYPSYIRGVVSANAQIVMMDIAESPVFDNINPLETRYFNNNEREIPTVCSGAFQINRSPKLKALASSVMIHGYLNGDIYQRSQYLDKIKGFPIVKMKFGSGTIIASTMLLAKGITDPIAAKLLINMMTDLIK